MGEFAAIVSALVSALSLLLGEVRRRRHQMSGGEDIRGALVDLCMVLGDWAARAADTNLNAREWADALPGSAGLAREYLNAVVDEQRGAMQQVRDHFDRPIVLNPHVVGERERPLTAENLLRIYAPEVLELAPRMVERQRQLKDGVADDLEHRYHDEGIESVHRYLLELEHATEGLREARDVLWQFIRREFPLGTPRSPSP